MKIKILLINKFLYPKGGDAISAMDTGRSLISKGHKVIFWGMQHPANPSYLYSNYFVPYVDLNNPGSAINKLKIVFNMFYSMDAKRRIEKIIQAEHPDIVHLHNFAHQISPSILDIFVKYKIPVVMTMHDYKLVCASYLMLSNNRICELCKNGQYFYCFLQKCVKNSTVKSFLNTAEMYLHHRILRIYDSIKIFISPSQFLKSKLENMGFNGKIVYLPNFVDINNFIPRYDWDGNYIIYFGRLSKEKGLLTLIEAIKAIPSIKLKIIGEGPFRDALESEIQKHRINNIEFLGYKCGEELKDEIKRAMFVVVPSEWYENNPRSIIESFALGKPVIGADIGGIPELVKFGETGLTFSPGIPVDLKEKIQYLLNNTDKIIEMGKRAKKFIESEFDTEIYYIRLMEIYKEAMNNP